ncbi:MAG: hypothetical protein WD512_03290 [Candidatus Paceibacterota bacterium]
MIPLPLPRSLPRSVPLPVLVKEKVEYYYKRQVWFGKIKLMHKEYINQVMVFENPFFCGVSWKIKNTRHSFVNVCDLSDNSSIFHHKLGVQRFVDVTPISDKTIVVKEFSKYYYYSSGFNNPTGYK